LFSLLGVNAQLGRTFSLDEDQPGTNHVVVLSNDLWQRRFGGDLGVVGRSITLNDQSYNVIGVMPSDFRFYTKTDVWTTLAFDPKEANERQSNYLVVIGRRQPGISMERATAKRIKSQGTLSTIRSQSSTHY
jgi:putative ABC transport system permease protein